MQIGKGYNALNSEYSKCHWYVHYWNIWLDGQNRMESHVAIDTPPGHVHAYGLQVYVI